MGPQNLPYPPHMISALTRRGVDPKVLMNQSPMQTQVTPGSPNYDPSMQTPTTPPMPDHPATMGPVTPAPTIPPASSAPGPAAPNSPQGAFLNSIAPGPGAEPSNPQVAAMQGQSSGGVNPLQSEAESIVSTLSDRLKHHSNQAKKFLQAIIDSSVPEQPASPAGPTA